MTLDNILAAATQTGLAFRGGFHPDPDEASLPTQTGTILLFGFIGQSGWAQFVNSPEAEDRAPHPLDRWSKRQIDALAQTFGAAALYPFGGPPYHPFQRWALRSEPVSPSPLGLMIHPVYGLWHSYRGALILREKLDLPEQQIAASPCTACIEKPCLKTCPVSAFTSAGYNVEACAAHLRDPAQTCLKDGCLARNACPIGAEFRYSAAQMQFYMAAFHRAHP